MSGTAAVADARRYTWVVRDVFQHAPRLMTRMGLLGGPKGAT